MKKVENKIFWVLLLITTLVLVGCATNNGSTNGKELTIKSWGLYQDVGNNKLKYIEENKILPKQLDTIFGFNVENNGEFKIDFVQEVYAKKFNETKENKILSKKLTLKKNEGTFCCIGFNEESDFEYEYWIIKITNNKGIIFEKKFILSE